jgi:hypothetical protein
MKLGGTSELITRKVCCKGGIVREAGANSYASP